MRLAPEKLPRKEGEEMDASKVLEQFLDFVNSAEGLMDQAIAGQQEAEAETQDILHALELEKHSYHEAASLARKLAKVRQARRQEKDIVAQLAPVVEWAKENDVAIRRLQRVLGELRKVDRNIQNRFYTPRTNVLENE